MHSDSSASSQPSVPKARRCLLSTNKSLIYASSSAVYCSFKQLPYIFMTGDTTGKTVVSIFFNINTSDKTRTNGLIPWSKDI